MSAKKEKSIALNHLFIRTIKVHRKNVYSLKYYIEYKKGLRPLNPGKGASSLATLLIYKEPRLLMDFIFWNLINQL